MIVNKLSHTIGRWLLILTVLIFLGLYFSAPKGTSGWAAMGVALAHVWSGIGTMFRAFTASK